MHPSLHSPFRHQLSRHALVRMQQRSIPHFLVDLLIELTDPVPAGSGCSLHRFDADSWAEAQHMMGGRARELDRYRNAYVIVAEDGLVVTAARLN